MCATSFGAASSKVVTECMKALPLPCTRLSRTETPNPDFAQLKVARRGPTCNDWLHVRGTAPTDRTRRHHDHTFTFSPSRYRGFGRLHVRHAGPRADAGDHRGADRRWPDQVLVDCRD